MAHLILVHQPTKQSPDDLARIAEMIMADVPAIKVHVVDTKAARSPVPSGAGDGPVVTVSMMPIKKFAPPPGPVFQGFEHPKSAQYEWIEEIGVAVPRWCRIEPDTRLEPADWGPYVVVKPELGRKGAEVRIKRTERVRFRAAEAFADDHPGRKGGMLAQEFIYTGPWAANYRVVTLFGKTLMCWKCEADHGLPPLTAKYAFDTGGVTIVSNKRSSHYSLADEADVIAMGEAVHGAFPDQPLLGSDIIRDARTGKLYLLECNPRGDTWYMSSATGEMIQAANKVDFTSQFGALRLAADALAEKMKSLMT